MSKLFIGAEVAVPEAAYAHAGIAKDDPNRQKNPHLTFQFCGTEMTDDDVRALLPIWDDVLAKTPDPHHRRVTITDEYALFGKEHDILVLKCRVSPDLEDAVAHARARSAEVVPHMPPSDFPFSPHVTLCSGATCLPPPTTGVSAGFAELQIDGITFWGQDYVVRAELDADVA